MNRQGLFPEPIVCCGDEIRVVLMAAFELEKIVVAATLLSRKFATDVRTRLVHGATARLLVKEPTGSPEMRIGPAPQDAFAAMS